MARKILAALMAPGIFGSLSLISGCNTVARAGQDVERGGQTIQGEAREVQKKI
jgi:entericidin B